MTVVLSSADIGPIVLVALLVVIIGRRVVMMVRGTPVRPARMFTIAAFYVALFAVTIVASYTQLPLWTYGLDAVVVVLAGIGTTLWVRRLVVVEWKNGVWMYRLGAVIPAVYLTLFVVRLGIDLFVLGVNPFDFTLPSTAPLSGLPLILVVVVNALFAFSTGLLVGRTTGVYLEYRTLSAAGPPPGGAAAAPPTAPLA
jgi:hypothetical protein